MGNRPAEQIQISHFISMAINTLIKSLLFFQQMQVHLKQRPPRNQFTNQGRYLNPLVTTIVGSFTSTKAHVADANGHYFYF